MTTSGRQPDALYRWIRAKLGSETSQPRAFSTGSTITSLVVASLSWSLAPWFSVFDRAAAIVSRSGSSRGFPSLPRNEGQCHCLRCRLCCWSCSVRCVRRDCSTRRLHGRLTRRVPSNFTPLLMCYLSLGIGLGHVR